MPAKAPHHPVFICTLLRPAPIPAWGTGLFLGVDTQDPTTFMVCIQIGATTTYEEAQPVAL